MEKQDIPKIASRSVNTVSKWFKEEEFYWRSLASYVWLIMMFPLLFGLYIALVNLSLLSPLSWITESFSLMFNFSTIVSTLFLQVVCSLTTYPHARSLAVKKTSHPSNLKQTLFLLHPKQLVNIICFLSASLIMSSTLTRFASSGQSEDGTAIFSIFGGFLGLFYAITYYQKHAYVVEFPVIQQTRFFRLKKMLNPCFHESLLLTVKALKYYYPLYVLIGLLPNSILPAIFSVDATLFGTILSLCSIPLFFNLFILSLAIMFVFEISNALVKIFNTQVYTFPLVENVSAEPRHETLADAMENSDLFLKHLAFIDYHTLSRYEGPRRNKMFDLSPPGSQAHCWNRTSSECLKVIENMRLQLSKEHEKKQIFRQESNVNTGTPKNIGSHELFSAENNTTKTIPPVNTSWFGSPSNLLRLPKLHNKEEIVGKVVQKPTSTPGLFEDLEITLLCLEGLCNLVGASVREDKYGVVQQKLPDILEELSLLLEACELFSKSSINVPSTNHSQHVEAAQINNTHATSLKLAVKTSLYTITTAFGYHISNVRLRTKRIHGFLEFAE